MGGVDKPHVKLGDRIRKLLDESNISQRELARRLDVGPNQVSRWIVGGVAPTYTVLNDILKICRKFHSASWLLTGKGSMDQKNPISTGNTENSNFSEEELERMKDLIISLQSKVISLNEELKDRDRQIEELIAGKKVQSIRR